MNEVYVSYNGTLYVPYIAVYVYWDVICCLHECITEGGLPVLTSVLTELNNNCACLKRALGKSGDDKTNHSNNIATRWRSF